MPAVFPLCASPVTAPDLLSVIYCFAVCLHWLTPPDTESLGFWPRTGTKSTVLFLLIFPRFAPKLSLSCLVDNVNEYLDAYMIEAKLYMQVQRLCFIAMVTIWFRYSRATSHEFCLESIQFCFKSTSSVYWMYLSSLSVWLNKITAVRVDEVRLNRYCRAVKLWPIKQTMLWLGNGYCVMSIVKRSHLSIDWNLLVSVWTMIVS